MKINPNVAFGHLSFAVIPDSIRDPGYLKLRWPSPADGGIASLVRNDDLFLAYPYFQTS
jgi:hypothetical protein